MTTDTETGDASLSFDSEIVTTLRRTRASWMYVEFISRHPECLLARRLAEQYAHGMLSEPEAFSPDHGAFGKALWEGRLDSALLYADSSNERLLRTLLQL